jgi:hypothetical protein
MWPFSDSAQTSEVIRPDSVGNYDQWAKTSGDNYTNIDEATPDTNYLSEATKGEKTSFGFANVAASYNSITSIRVGILVTRHATLTHTLLVKCRISGTDYNFGSGTVDIGPGSGDVLVFLDSSTDPSTSLPWTQAGANSLEIVLEKGEGKIVTTEDKSYSVPIAITGGSVKTFANLPTTTSWGTTVPTTSLIITYIENNAFDVRELWYRQYGTATWNNADGSSHTDTPVTDSKTATHLAPWIPLTGTASQFQLISGRQDGNDYVQSVTALTLRRVGTVVDDTGTLQVNQVYATVEGQGVGAVQNGLLLFTSAALMRCSEDLTSYSDIIGTASDPTASEGAFWDAATFIGKLYVTNGTDQLFKFPNGTNTFDQLSGHPTGRCIAGYGGHLLLGDVTENGIREPSRVRWSATHNANNWTDTSSGNIELDETPGTVMRMRPLVEQSTALVGVLAVYKTTGIYHLTPTPSASDPYDKKLMDGSSGCIAPGSLVGFSDVTGREQHVFLGQIGGTLNVMSWNGAQTQQFGFEIVPILKQLGDIVNLSKSIATIDVNGNYILMFPTSNSTYLKTALVYNFNKKLWTTWTLHNVTALGTWTPNTGRDITVLGRPDSFAYYLDDSVSTDDIEGEDGVPITATLETADFSLMDPEIWKNGVLERIWMFYRADSSEAEVITDVSTDGGVTYRVNENDTSHTDAVLGTQELGLLRVPTRMAGRKHRVRFKQTKDDGNPIFLQTIYEVEDGGVESP